MRRLFPILLFVLAGCSGVPSSDRPPLSKRVGKFMSKTIEYNLSGQAQVDQDELKYGPGGFIGEVTRRKSNELRDGVRPTDSPY